MKESRGHRFIGRTGEQGILRGAARSAARGLPRVVLVSGPAGMGKTTLVEQFAERAAEEFTLLRAWDLPPRTDLPFYTVTGLLADADERGAEEHRSGTGPGARAPGGSVLALGGAVVGLLGSLQEKAPVLLWLDDAHRIDPESLQAIGFALLRQQAERVLTVVCTQQAARTVRDMGLADLVPESDRIALSGFGLAETQEFVEDRTARSHSRGKLRGLAVWSDGNPLFLEAALGAFGGELPDDPAAFGVPASLSKAVSAWSRSFPPAGRAILDMLAVLNTPAALPFLGQLLGSDAVGADAEVLVQQRAARWRPGAYPALDLVHAGQRDALYAAIPLPERNRMHRRAAELLAPPARWRHRVAAAETYDADLAGELREAGLRETRAGHPGPAAEYLLASRAVDPDSERRLSALLDAVRLQVTAGRLRSALRQEEVVLRSAPGPQRDEALGLLALAQGRDSRARRYLRDARTAFDERGDLAAAACAAAELGVAEGALALGEDAFATSAYALRHAPDEAVRGLAEANLAYAHALLGGPARGLAHLGRLPALPADVPATHTEALIYRGLFRGLSGDLSGGVDDLTGAARRHSLGLSRISSVWPLTHSLWCHFMLGTWQEARRNLTLALDVAHTTGRPADFFSLACFSALLDAFSGRFDEARSALREAGAQVSAADFAGSGFHLAATEAGVEFAAGDHEAVVALLSPVLALGVNEGRSRLYAVRYAPMLGVAYARTGDTARARETLRGMGVWEGHGALLPVAVRWVRGAVAVAEGDLRAAANAYRAGLAVPRDGGDPVMHRAAMELDLGAVLLESGDAEGARGHLGSAEEVFARLGAEPARQRCRSLLDSLGAPPVRPGPGADLWEGLSDRERDIAELVARGWTNREIAVQLYLSAKTVEYHLGHIYARNHIRGRRELRDRMQSRPE
ncbi:AAA family ATPase [Streptomyces microflavus]|uniref:AAA family ATPase n=1 Tax=Streptomyces microflavus TaxID=1919 RepID=UPI002DDC8802|nr:AAA family ATPase [Streptomyces microflavus]WSA58883.1 AAA family ATPase [Streptomyces microflavus]